MNLLAIDDDPTLLALLSSKLSRAGCSVTTAGNGPEALNQLEAQSFPLIISSYDLPGMNGLELAREIRRRHGHDSYIIFLTAHDATVEKIDGFHAGVDAYLSKPFHMSELMASINTALLILSETNRKAPRREPSAA